MVEEGIPVVTITGISGYIGAHVAKTFLEQGGYRVRGTVRSLASEKKTGPVREFFAAELASGSLELKEADLMDAAMDSRVQRQEDACS